MADDYSDAISDVLGPNTASTAAVAGSTQENPDKAAQALNLSATTGVPAPVINADLDNFVDQHKAAVGADIVRNNPQLGQLMTKPLAPAVTNDDLATLDQVSQHASTVAAPSVWDRMKSVADATKSGFDFRGQADDFNKLYNLVDSPIWKELVTLSTPGNPAFLANLAAHTFQAGIEGGSEAVSQIYGALHGEQAYDKVSQGIGSVYGALGSKTAAGQDVKGLGTPEALKADLVTAAQTSFAPESHLPIEFNDLAKAAQKSAAVAKPYLDAGVSPPVGIDPVIDAGHLAQNQADLAALNDMLKTSLDSTTKTRAPGMFADFIRQHTEDSYGIAHDAVRDLYGLKTPDPTDGLLGFVNDLPSQLLRSAVTGQDIQVPIADYVTHIDPAVHSQLEPFIRTREDGITQAEADAVKPEQYTPATDVQEQLAARAGLDLPRPSEEPTLQYQIDPNAPNYHFVENGRGRIGLTAREEADGTWTGEYADVGEGEGTSKVIRDLKTIAAPDGMLGASADVVSHVLDHIGAGEVPTYTVRPNNAAVRGNLGSYFPSSDAIALRHTGDPTQMLQTAVHEGLHAAFHSAIDNNPEMRSAVEELRKEAVAQTAHDGGRFQTEAGKTDHYGLVNPHEFISEAFSNPEFQEYLSSIPATPELLQRLGLNNLPKSRISNLWDAFLMAARKAFGLPLTDESMSLFDATMKVGDRLTRSVEDVNDRYALNQMGAQFAQPLPPDPIFDKAAALGMNKAQATRYRDLILKKENADFEARKAAILRDEERRQTKEWKENSVEVRKEVSPDITSRPDVRADAILRGGEKLDTDALTPEQREAFPDDHTRGGLSPDDLAQNVGYSTGDEMLQALSNYRTDRGPMRNQDYVRKLISDETNRRMEERYGNKAQNVLEAARDRVLSEGQFDILQAEAEAAAGGDVPFTKANLQANVKSVVADTPMSAVKSDAAIQAAGRAASGIEDALLKGDAKAGFVQRMRQYNSLLAAKEMARIEKLRSRFEDKMATYRKREITGASQEYVNQIHSLMTKLGYAVNRSVQDIRENIQKNGYDDLRDFVNQKEGRDGNPAYRQDLHVPDWLSDPEFSKKVDDLTAGEFEQLNDAITAMIYNARNEHKVTVGGVKFDYAEIRDGLVQQLKEVLPDRKTPKDLDNPSGLKTAAKSYWWSSINLESMFNRFDRDDPVGKFNQALTRTFTEAMGDRERMLIDYNRRMRDLGDFGDMNKAVENDLFVDPEDGQPFQMKRRHVLGVLQNVGNESNMRKLAEGYKVSPQAIMDFLHKNTVPEDWDRAQKIGDLFKELINKADDMSHNVSGVGIQKIDLKPFTDPHGVEREGWYNPVAYDRLRGTKTGRGGSLDDLDTSFYRATTPQTYTKTRTGYIGQMQLNLDIVPTRMKQMIHDITTREAVQQLGKFFYDPVFKNAIRDHYGFAQAQALEPFLRDFANAPNFESEAARNQNKLIGAMATNMVTTAIGLNPGTVLKHGLGALQKSLLQQPIGFTKALVSLLGKDAETGNSNWTRALELSDECKRRMRNFEDTVTNAGQNISLKGSGEASYYKSVKAFAQYIGGWPIGAFDMLSSVPTFLASYDRAIAEGHDVGQAKFLADRDVRQTHGSSILTNRPEIARSTNALARTFSGFYGVFSENLQKQYQLAWMVKDAYGLAKEGEYGMVAKALPKVAGVAFTSTIMMAAIEHAVDSNDQTKKESWAQYAGDILFKSATSSMIGIRDLGNSITSGRDPGGNLLSSYEKAIGDPVKDVYHAMLKHDIREVWSKQKAGQFLKNIAIMTGALTGLTNAQEGRLAQFMYNYSQGREHPKTGVDFATGVWHGSLRNHRR